MLLNVHFLIKHDIIKTCRIQKKNDISGVMKVKIGFFDSGVGGLTVLGEALKRIPNHEYLYYADTTHTPYGSKPREEVRQYVIEAIDFLINKGAEIIVIACNTATSIAAAELREKYSIPIIGMEPAVKPALEISQKVNKRVLVTATALTLKEEKMKKLLEQFDANHRVDLCPLPGLVKLAEKFDFTDESVISYLKEAFSSYDLTAYGSVVLGCTHFPLFKKQFKQLFSSDVVLVDGSQGTVKHLEEIVLEKSCLVEKASVKFYSSGILAQTPSELKPFKNILTQLGVNL